MEIKTKLFILFIFSHFTNAGNILVLIARPYKSHIVWINVLATELAERGHNITFLSTDIYGKEMPNMHHLQLDVTKEMHKKAVEEFDLFAMGEEINIDLFINEFRVIQNTCAQSTGYQRLLEYPDDFKFDLVIFEYTEEPILLDIVEKFGDPPIIGASSVAVPFVSNYVIPSLISPSFVKYNFIRNSRSLSGFCGRFVNYLNIFRMEIYKRYNAMPLNQLKNVEFKRKVKLILVNKHPAADELSPLWPNVIPVGGLHIKPSKDLPKDLKDILDKAKDGAILFSLGTVAESSKLGKARLTEIVEAFRALPQYTFLWKYENSFLLFERPPNVVIRKWLPQNDILAHPNVKLFITHGGILSIHETIWHGVPALGVPVLLDQFSNIEYCVGSGFAEEEDITKIERNSFKKLIIKMINDPKYKENVKLHSKLFRDQIDSPLERAVWWTEFVMRHPNMTFMSPPYTDVSPFIRHSWDVLAFIFSIFLIIFYIIFVLISFFIRKCIKKYLFSHFRKVKNE
ncbi:UDP-glycosyltransferase UGT5-like [Lutzomyia longipalpis]|uniref:UDP-glycosyltransferase UGT5-like n=1 Tax=Lutzomyia longipalpis TaxID=7200 RepID=UPI002483FAE7|nr:UDP-glycosyltransferase UGT5-like [Lutzomyia longipalpis]